jgi:hypothetical protein
VTATAYNDGAQRATAYGVRFLSFDGTGSFVNNGVIAAMGVGASGGWAIGAQIDDAAQVTNSGKIEGASIDTSSGLVALGCAEVLNSGTIVAESLKGTSYGVYQEDGRLVNRTGASIKALCAAGNAFGLYTQKVDVINNGTVTGDCTKLIDSRLAGTGTFVGDLFLENGQLSPGDGGIGRLTVDGNLNCTGSLAMRVEIGAGGFDQVAVNGSATLNGESSLTIVPVGYAAGGDYTIIKAVSTLGNGSFATVTAPALFAGTISGGAGGFVLALTRHSYADFPQRPELAPMCRALDRVAPHATGGVAAMLSRIDNYADGTSVRAALPQLQPAINASAGAAALQGVQRTSAQLAAFSRAYPDGGVSGSATTCSAPRRPRDRGQRRLPRFDNDTDGGWPASITCSAVISPWRRIADVAIAAGAGVHRSCTPRIPTRLSQTRWTSSRARPAGPHARGLGDRIRWRRVDFLAKEVGGCTGHGILGCALRIAISATTADTSASIDRETPLTSAPTPTRRSGAELASRAVQRFVARRRGASGIHPIRSRLHRSQPRCVCDRPASFCRTEGLLAAFAGATLRCAHPPLLSDRTERSAALRAKLARNSPLRELFTHRLRARRPDYAHVVSASYKLRSEPTWSEAGAPRPDVATAAPLSWPFYLLVTQPAGVPMLYGEVGRGGLAALQRITVRVLPQVYIDLQDVVGKPIADFLVHLMATRAAELDSSTALWLCKVCRTARVPQDSPREGLTHSSTLLTREMLIGVTLEKIKHRWMLAGLAVCTLLTCYALEEPLVVVSTSARRFHSRFPENHVCGRVCRRPHRSSLRQLELVCPRKRQCFCSVY